MRLHRISLACYSQTAMQAFCGDGGLYGLGRWHTRGHRIVYTAQNTSLAMAECLVHLQRSTSVAPFNLWHIDVPDSLVSPPPALPAGWKKDPAHTQALGDKWLASKSSVALLVPSAVVPGEFNCLLNPEHRDFNLGWVAPGPTSFCFDTRLTRP